MAAEPCFALDIRPPLHQSSRDCWGKNNTGIRNKLEIYKKVAWNNIYVHRGKYYSRPLSMAGRVTVGGVVGGCDGGG